MDETPKDLKELTKQAAELKDIVVKAETALKVQKTELSKVTAAILKALEFMELEKVSGHGYLFFTETKSSVKTPKTKEAKKALFDYLESQGIFLEMASVNSQTLNSLYKNLAEQAMAEGNIDFKLPGVEEPTSYTNLKMRKAK